MPKRTWIQSGSSWKPLYVDGEPPGSVRRLAEEMDALIGLAFEFGVVIQVGGTDLLQTNCRYEEVCPERGADD